MIKEGARNDRASGNVPSRRNKRSSTWKLFPSKDKPREWVHYLVAQIEEVTGDTHSRTMFGIIAASLPDGVIFETLSQIKQGEGIRNAGAVFVSAAKKWAAMRKRKQRLAR